VKLPIFQASFCSCAGNRPAFKKSRVDGPRMRSQTWPLSLSSFLRFVSARARWHLHTLAVLRLITIYTYSPSILSRLLCVCSAVIVFTNYCRSLDSDFLTAPKANLLYLLYATLTKRPNIILKGTSYVPIGCALFTKRIGFHNFGFGILLQNIFSFFFLLYGDFFPVRLFFIEYDQHLSKRTS